MEKCKFCQQELDEGTTLCPHCGRDNAESVEKTVEAPASETAETKVDVTVHVEKKATPGRIALAVAAVVVLLAVLIALIAVGAKSKYGTVEIGETAVADSETVQETEAPATIPADGNPDDVTCKGTYTVTDEEALAAKDTVIATIGDHQLTNGVLQAHYWSAVNGLLSSQQGYYLMMYGAIDYQKPLDTQICAVNNEITWQQHFLQQALHNWRTSCALASEAEKAGVGMSQEDQEFLANIESYMNDTAASYGITLEELMHSNMGPGAGLEELTEFQTLYSRGSSFYEAELNKLQPTEEDLAAFFAEHEEEYAQGGLTKDSKFVDVRHILATVKGGTTDEEGNTTYSEEEWAACEAEAQAILDAWLAGEKTEDSFAALANEKSEDPGSNTAGGLYEKVFEGQMVKPFEDWCFDDSRAHGDYGMVKTDYGYHIMFFVDSQPQWKYYAEQDWIIDATNKLIDGMVEGYPIEVDYSKIVLGYMELGQ